MKAMTKSFQLTTKNIHSIGPLTLIMPFGVKKAPLRTCDVIYFLKAMTKSFPPSGFIGSKLFDLKLLPFFSALRVIYSLVTFSQYETLPVCIIWNNLEDKRGQTQFKVGQLLNPDGIGNLGKQPCPNLLYPDPTPIQRSIPSNPIPSVHL